MKKQDKIGVIAGAGPLAGALFYQRLIEYAHKSRQMPEVVLVNYPFRRQSTSDEFVEQLQSCIDVLAAQKTTRLAIACNTLHGLLDKLSLHGMELVHLPQALLRHAKERGVKRLLLLSTARTVKSRLYQDDAYELYTLEPEEQTFVGAVIDRVLDGTVLKADSEELSRLIKKKYDKTPFDAVILGCTELPVLHAQHPLDIGKIVALDSIDSAAREAAFALS